MLVRVCGGNFHHFRWMNSTGEWMEKLVFFDGLAQSEIITEKSWIEMLFFQVRKTASNAVGN